MVARKVVRQERLLDTPLNLKPFVGKKVGITGACGSIGSALFAALEGAGAEVCGVDWSEELVAASLHRDRIALSDFIEFNRPVDYLFHCAAYKHVILGEKNAAAFEENNFWKVHSFLGEFVRRNPTSRFVLISTDKAAGKSIMGQTKNWAEHSVIQAGQCAIRLVNVAYSRGSVLDRWANDPNPQCVQERSVRYWMSMGDAVAAILDVAGRVGLYTVLNAPMVSIRELCEAFEIETSRVIGKTGHMGPGEAEEERLISEKEKLELVHKNLGKIIGA